MTKWIKPGKTEIKKVAAMEKTQWAKHLMKPIKYLLVCNGITTKKQFDMIMDDDLAHLNDPASLLDSDKFLNILQENVEKASADKPYNIVVYGDYDADGVMSTYVMQHSLELIFGKKVNVNHFINDRFKDGYGIQEKGVKKLVAKYPDTQMLITVDNGIVGFDGIDYATKQDIKVLVTDHHNPDPTGKLPNAEAVVDLHREGDKYPFKGLSGTGVAWKLMLLVSSKINKNAAYNKIFDLIDYVGISTVGDVMPLLGENRIIVKEAIKRINTSPWGSRHAIRTMLQAFVNTNKTHLPIDEETFKFCLIPMMNAESRMTGNIETVFKTFNSRNTDEIQSYVTKLFKINEHRKQITNNLMREISEKHLVDTSHKIIILENDTIGEGVIGLVAGKLEAEYNRPTIVLTKDPDGNVLKGSCRSIDGFDITDALHKVDDDKDNGVNLLQFGGHSKAAGLSLDASTFEQFKESLYSIADHDISDDALTKSIKIQMIVKQSEMTPELIKQIDSLKPLGEGFDVPNILVDDFVANQVSFLPKRSEKHPHVQFKGIDNRTKINYWYGAKHVKELVPDIQDKTNNTYDVSVIGSIQDSTFTPGTIELTVMDDNIKITEKEV